MSGPEIPAALARLLGDPAFGEAARAVAAEMADLPDVRRSIPLLEELVAR
jgi:hypothetical protein